MHAPGPDSASVAATNAPILGTIGQRDDAFLDPIMESSTDLIVMGVRLPKGDGGPRTPVRGRFARNILTDHDLRLMQKIAVGLDLNQPVLIEGGSGLGKSETIERLGSMLNREIYYANCHDFTPDVLIGGMKVTNSSSTGFGWVDGVVIQAIRNGGILFLDEYNFMNGETRGRLHEIIDAVLNKKPHISLVENGSERVRVHPDFRLTTAQNPPGHPFKDREVLDPAQLSRFFYIKEPSDIPVALKRARIQGMLGKPAPTRISQGEFLSTEQEISRAALRAMNEIGRELANGFIGFHNSIRVLVESGKLGAAQPQPIHLVYPRDIKRVFTFFLRYFDGDPQRSMARATDFYFTSMFESQNDKARVHSEIKRAFSGANA